MFRLFLPPALSGFQISNLGRGRPAEVFNIPFPSIKNFFLGRLREDLENKNTAASGCFAASPVRVEAARSAQAVYDLAEHDAAMVAYHAASRERFIDVAEASGCAFDYEWRALAEDVFGIEDVLGGISTPEVKEARAAGAAAALLTDELEMVLHEGLDVDDAAYEQLLQNERAARAVWEGLAHMAAMDHYRGLTPVEGV